MFVTLLSLHKIIFYIVYPNYGFPSLSISSSFPPTLPFKSASFLSMLLEKYWGLHKFVFYSCAGTKLIFSILFQVYNMWWSDHCLLFLTMSYDCCLFFLRTVNHCYENLYHWITYIFLNKFFILYTIKFFIICFYFFVWLFCLHICMCTTCVLDSHVICLVDAWKRT